MECSNCNCSLTTYDYSFECDSKVYVNCSKSCNLAKIKELMLLQCNSNINSIKRASLNLEDKIKSLEDTIMSVKKEMEDIELSDNTKEEYEMQIARLQKMVDGKKRVLKLFRLSIIILVSIREKKGTYQVLKQKYSSLCDNFMMFIETDGDLCWFAGSMKRNHESPELFYNILK